MMGFIKILKWVVFLLLFVVLVGPRLLVFLFSWL